MTLTLELTPAQEERLRRKATERGQDLNDYAQSVLLSDMDAPLTPTEAEDLRTRLRSFAQDWDRADMDVYDAL